MKFKDFLFESTENKTTVFAFGRMNPPTTGHEKLVNKVHELAKQHKADHLVVMSHSQDAAKNPLSAEQKLKHAKRFFPKTNLAVSSKETPSFLAHAAELHKKGTQHLVMVAGSDRVPEYEKTLKKYNGEGEGKLYNFKSIKVVSAGERDPDAEGAEGMSASKMRAHAKANNFSEFRKGVPSHVSDKHAKELFNDVQSGMNAKKKDVREQYMNCEIFNIGDTVLDEKDNEVIIIGRGSNYVVVEETYSVVDGQMATPGAKKKWLNDVKDKGSKGEQPDVQIATGEKSMDDVERNNKKKGFRNHVTSSQYSEEKQIPRLLMTKDQIEEAQAKATGSQISYDGYTTKNFDVEPRAKKMYDDLIKTVPEPVAKEVSAEHEKQMQVQVGALVKPMGFRHQQFKQYLNL